MGINALLQEVIEEMRKIKIPVKDNIYPEVIIKKGIVSRAGRCYSKANGHFQIEISNWLLDTSIKTIKNTLAHEILHTCAGCFNHGVLWKTYASRMNKEYGYSIARVTNINDSNADETTREIIKERYEAVSNAARYVIECEKCGQKICRMRKSKLVKQIENYRCRCGGFLILIKGG